MRALKFLWFLYQNIFIGSIIEGNLKVRVSQQCYRDIIKRSKKLAPPCRTGASSHISSTDPEGQGSSGESLDDATFWFKWIGVTI